MFPSCTPPVFEAKATAEGRITGYASVFGGVDSYGDTIHPGAFAESIAAALPVMLWAHDQSRPIGKWLEAREDSRGLYVAGQLNLKTSAGAEAFEHLRAGDIAGLSIGYSVAPGGAERRGEVRILKRVNLREVSPVALPADPAARVLSVKALATARDLERALRSLGLSQRQAKALMAGGYRALADAPDDDELNPDDLAALAASIRRIRI
jgi:HK97 family phage prohead protease